MMIDLLPKNNKGEEFYLRANVNTDAQLDDKDIEQMKRDGHKMYENHQIEIENMLRNIVDQKIGKRT